jgi:hypothetical protein
MNLGPQLKAKLGKPLYQGTLNRDSMVLMTLAKQGTFCHCQSFYSLLQFRDTACHGLNPHRDKTLLAEETCKVISSFEQYKEIWERYSLQKLKYVVPNTSSYGFNDLLDSAQQIKKRNISQMKAY